uniref:Uncharacterized protein n=1 Tax=mine drainage metagenome TaxID=410659 RepID=E6QLT0_9ZZZZ
MGGISQEYFQICVIQLEQGSVYSFFVFDDFFAQYGLSGISRFVWTGGQNLINSMKSVCAFVFRSLRCRPA